MTYHAYTTLNEIWRRKPYMRDWEKLLAHLGKTEADDEPLHFSAILDCLGTHGALWFLRVKSLDRLSRHFQAWCADQVLHHFEVELPKDRRVRDKIDMLRGVLGGLIQRIDAWSAAMYASDAAYTVAWDAAWADWDAADAARADWDAADWDSAWNDTWSAALAAADAARSAAQAAQEAKLRAMIWTPSEGTNQ